MKTKLVEHLIKPLFKSLKSFVKSKFSLFQVTFLFHLLLSNLLPILVIVILNAKIWMTINKPSVARKNYSVVKNNSEVVEKKQCRMLLSVVLIFLLCQTPRMAFILQMCLTGTG